MLAGHLVLGSRGHMGDTDVPEEGVWDGGIGSQECRQGKTSHMTTLLMIMVTKATSCEGLSARRKLKGRRGKRWCPQHFKLLSMRSGPSDPSKWRGGSGMPFQMGIYQDSVLSNFCCFMINFMPFSSFLHLSLQFCTSQVMGFWRSIHGHVFI